MNAQTNAVVLSQTNTDAGSPSQAGSLPLVEILLRMAEASPDGKLEDGVFRVESPIGDAFEVRTIAIKDGRATELVAKQQ